MRVCERERECACVFFRVPVLVTSSLFPLCPQHSPASWVQRTRHIRPLPRRLFRLPGEGYRVARGKGLTGTGQDQGYATPPSQRLSLRPY